MKILLLVAALFSNAAFGGCFARTLDEGGCKVTPSAPAGPFIQTEGVIQKGTELCREEYSETGEAAPDAERVELSGFILDEDCKTPVSPKDREVELLIWQADSNGVYDDHLDETSHYCRGWMRVKGDGSYKVNSFIPGYYGSRPRHFHVMIAAEGYRTLITQLYFGDDPKLSKEGRSCCNEGAEELWMSKEKGKGKDYSKVKYNFYLERTEDWEP